MQFFFSSAPAGSSPDVQAIWIARADRSSAFPADPIMPDGCMEVVFNLGDPFVEVTPKGAVAQPRVLLVGQMTAPTTVRPTGTVDLVGLRLRPEQAASFFGVPAWTLKDHLLPADAVMGPQVTLVAEALADCADPATRVRTLADRLGDLTPSRRRSPPPVLTWALDRMRRTRGRERIERTATTAGITRRQLERFFHDHVGLSPKAFARIVRVQHALALIERLPDAAGPEIAASCGYADQSHLIRDFRALVGDTPTRLDQSGAALGSALRSR